MTQTKPAAPGPDKAARLATVSARIDRNDIILLGTFGKETAPAALLRLPSGETRRVEAGDTVAGLTVIAVNPGSVVIDAAGNTTLLVPPGHPSPRQAPGHGSGR